MEKEEQNPVRGLILEFYSRYLKDLEEIESEEPSSTSRQELIKLKETVVDVLKGRLNSEARKYVSSILDRINMDLDKVDE